MAFFFLGLDKSIFITFHDQLLLNDIMHSMALLVLHNTLTVICYLY